MDALIEEMQAGGLINISRIRLYGKAKAVLDWFSLACYTKTFPDGQGYWKSKEQLLRN